jgi:tetratricopeptide (TPR) repeat protein
MRDPGPPDSVQRLRRADALLDAGRPADAAAEARQGLAAAPGDAGLLAVLALAQLRLGQAKDARATAEECVRVAPDDPEGHRLLGHALLDLRRRRAALRAFEAAQRLAPDHPAVLHALAHGLLAVRRKRHAAEVVARLSRIAPDWSATKELRSLVAAARRQWRQAEHESRSLLAAEANHLGGLYQLALAQERQGRLREAIETMHRALRTDPTSRDARRELMRLIDVRFRDPPMPYLMAVPFFQPLAAIAGIHMLWLHLVTGRMRAEHSPEVQQVIRRHLRARDSLGCLQLACALIAIFAFFWTLLTIAAPEDLATPTSIAWQAGLWLVVTILGFWIWRATRRRRPYL